MAEDSKVILSKALDSKEAAELIEWEAPIPFNDIELPKFPIECLPKELREYVDAVAEATQTPCDMGGVACLSVIALCVHGKYKIQGKEDWQEPLNIYSVIVMKSAERKSQVLRLATQYVEQYIMEVNKKLKSEIERNKLNKDLLIREIDKLKPKAANNSEIRKQLYKKQEELTAFEDLKPIRLITDDVSPEALISLLVENKGRIALVSSEGGIFETILGRYSNTPNLDVFLKGHCGDIIRVDRKGRPSEFVEHPALTMLLMAQPNVLDGLICNVLFRGRGLTARFLFSCPQSKVGQRRYETKPIPEDAKAAYKALCERLLSLPDVEEEKVIKLSDEAYKLSAKFAEELEPRLADDLEHIADFAGKLHGAILRIAGILHLVNVKEDADKTPLPEETMKAAIEIGRYFLEHALGAFQMMGADNQHIDAKYVLRQLEKQDDAQLKKYDVFRSCRGKFNSVADIEPSLEMLIEHGYIREIPPEKSQTSGRPAQNRYLLNPLYFNK